MFVYVFYSFSVFYPSIKHFPFYSLTFICSYKIFIYIKYSALLNKHVILNMTIEAVKVNLEPLTTS